jgi:hypothetical protein
MSRSRNRICRYHSVRRNQAATTTMKTFTTDYAAQHLDELIDLALQGQVILLSLNGDPVARLIPVDDDSGAEVPPSEVEEAFYGD